MDALVSSGLNPALAERNGTDPRMLSLTSEEKSIREEQAKLKTKLGLAKTEAEKAIELADKLPQNTRKIPDANYLNLLCYAMAENSHNRDCPQRPTTQQSRRDPLTPQPQQHRQLSSEEADMSRSDENANALRACPSS